jgi:Trypsin-like peptidase domain
MHHRSFQLIVSASIGYIGLGCWCSAFSECETMKTTGPMKREAAIKAIVPAIAFINATEKEENSTERSHKGLGVIIDPNGIVVVPSRLVQKKTEIQVTLSDGRTFAPKVVSVDAKQGLAILRIENDKPFQWAEFGNSDRVKPGDVVLSFSRIANLDPEWYLEVGAISERNADGGTEGHFDIESATSNRPERDLLFNMEGKVIGIWSKSGAIPSNKVRETVDEYRKK